MVRVGLGGARHGHVAVADRLDLLHAGLRGQLIESAEERIKQTDYACRISVLGPWRKACQVCKQDRGLGVSLRNPRLAMLEAFSDRDRYGIRQELLRPCLRLTPPHLHVSK